MNLIGSWFFSIGLITLVSLVLIVLFQGFYLKRLLADHDANKLAYEKLRLSLEETELAIASRYTEEEPISANGVKQILRFLKLDIAIDMADFKARDDYFLEALRKLQSSEIFILDAESGAIQVISGNKGDKNERSSLSYR